MADPQPVDPNVDPELPQPQTEPEVPIAQEVGNTDGYGSQNELAVPTADIRTAAAPVSPGPASGNSLRR
jgi:hypothetical protein